ncbi:MAG: small multi-drug export protein [Lachnospiraceae bacterium]|nr:small multi-drug export protein [Lachnospiraceae bacterium]
MHAVAEWFATVTQGKIPRELAVMLISMVPLLELRGGMIVARILDLQYWKSVIFCVLGNIIPIPFILLFIKQIFKWMKKFKGLGKIAEFFEKRAMKKSDKFKDGEFIALILFVGIPLPGTGAWMGSLIAALLEMDIKKAVVAELIGLFMAIIIMSILTYALPGVFSFF